MLKTWEQLRPRIDEAIRAGYMLKEFLELEGISTRRWYEIKPAKFNWSVVQYQLGKRPKIENIGRPSSLKKRRIDITEKTPSAVRLSWYEERIAALTSQIAKDITAAGLNDDLISLLKELVDLVEFTVTKKERILQWK